jgi:hypothetical protein
MNNFKTGTLRNGNFSEYFLRLARKQKLNAVSTTHLLDSVGGYHGKQYDKSVYLSNGISTGILSNHITNQTVISKDGTAILTLTTGQLAVGIGWVANILLSDGTFYKCEERTGINVYDSSGNGNHATLSGDITHQLMRSKDLTNYTNEVGYSKGLKVVESNDVFDTNISTDIDKVILYLQTSSVNQTVVGYNDISSTTNRNIIIDSEGKVSVNFDGQNKRNITVVTDNTIYKVIVDYVNKTIVVGSITTTETSTQLLSTYNSDILLGGGQDSVGSIFSSSDLMIIHPRFINGVTDVVYEGSDIAITNRTVAKYTNISATQMVDSIGLREGEVFAGRCYNFDGVDDYIASAYLLGSETVISYDGDAIPTISVGRLDITTGLIYNILLSDGTHYKCDEGGGTTAFDSSGNGNHGTITNATLSTFHTTDIGVSYSWLNQVGYSEGVNLLRYSNDFSKSEWIKSNVTISGNSIILDTANSSHHIVQPNQYFIAGEAKYFQFKVKFVDADWLKFNIWDGAVSAALFYKFSTSSFTTQHSSYGNLTHAIDANGYVFITGTFSGNTTSATGNIAIGPSLDGTALFTGDGLSSVLLKEIQVELGSVATDYQKTTSSPTADVEIPRDESNITKDVLGNDLQHVGLVKLNANFVESNCVNLDGTDDYGDLSYTLSTGTGEWYWEIEADIDESTNTSVRVLVSMTTLVSDEYLLFKPNYPNMKIESAGHTPNTGSVMPVNAAKFKLHFDGVDTLSLYINDVLNYSVVHTNPSKLINKNFTMMFGGTPGSASTLATKLWNVTISDANGLKTFPLAEGAGTISYAREDSTKFITWNNITEATFWGSTQGMYHSNIVSGFSDTGNGVKRPYKINGAYTNPAGAWHNNAETKLLAPAAPSLLKKFDQGSGLEHNTLLFNSLGVPISFNPYSIGNNYLGLNALFSEELIPNQLTNIIIAPLGFSEYEELAEDLIGNDTIIPIINNSSLDVTGELATYKGKVASDMKLINSNCIDSNGINVTGVFNFDCTGLSIVNYSGTADVTLDVTTNTITITEGTLYNLLLSNNYHFPIAEGLLDKSYKTESENVYINWNSITWGTQESYHYNINNGFYNLNNAKLPFKPVGLNYTNPKVAGHNGAETESTMEVFRENLGDSSFHYDQSTLSSNIIRFQDIIENSDNKLFYTNTTNRSKINIETFITGNKTFKTKRYKNGFHKNHNTL